MWQSVCLLILGMILFLLIKKHKGLSRLYCDSLLDKSILFLVEIFLVFGTTSLFSSPSTSALSFQDSVDVQFTFNPSLTITVSGDLVIDNLAPGSSDDSNIIDVNVSTNNITGYVLTATTGNTTHTTTELTQPNVTNKFTSLATNADLSSLTTDNTWGYSFSSDNGTNWTNYSGLPLYTAESGKELLTTSTNASTPIKFKIAAKASNTQPSGTYTNVINFIAVANPEPTLGPVACTPGYICYQPNALTGVQGTMADQDARQFDDSSCLYSDHNFICIDSEGDPVNVDTLPKLNTAAEKIMLYASNYSRSGYGFAGWSDVYDYETNPNAHFYGPEEDIDVPADTLENGTSLYAVWIKSAGSMQGARATQICNSLTAAPTNGPAGLASVSALTDQRDNQTYAIAKLADGNCWMIENLRLENTATVGAAKEALSQGYDSSFIGLANPESSNFAYTTNANSLYSVNGSTTITISGGQQPYRFPRYNNVNTQQRAEYSSTDVNTYSYGNYYTWAAVIADTNDYEGVAGIHNTTSICPREWSIPTGGIGGDFSSLDVDMGGTGNNQSGRDANARWRKYPYNFLFSGYYFNSSASQRYNRGQYWSPNRDSSEGRATIVSMQDDTMGFEVGHSVTFGLNVRCFLFTPTPNAF